MSDLRDEIARAIRDAFEDGRPSVTTVDEWHGEADAVLRVVGDALMGDEAVQAAWGEIHGDAVVIHDTVVCALSAAWRVVTGDTTPHGGTPAHEREARP